MPRGRGGARQGTPGKAYPNRTDLTAQAVRTAPSQSYGQATEQAAAQQAIPLPQAPEPGASAFHRPSERPAEPLTAGMPMGAGPGPSITQQAFDPIAETLSAAYKAQPSPQLAALIESHTAQ